MSGLKDINWRKKDWLDQPLHFLVAFAIGFIPPLILMIFVLDNPIYKIIAVVAFMIISGLTGELREVRQHKRWLFNLDLIFWMAGTTTAFVSLMAAILI